MFQKSDPSNKQKKMVPSYVSFNNFYGKMWAGFCFNTSKRFYLEVLFYKQKEDLEFL